MPAMPLPTALRSYSRGGKAQQLGVVGHEDELGFVCRQFNGADHPITRLEADHVQESLPRTPVHPLHHPEPCPVPGPVNHWSASSGRAPSRPPKRDQLADMGTALEVGCLSGGGTVGRSSVEILISRPALVIIRSLHAQSK